MKEMSEQIIKDFWDRVKIVLKSKNLNQSDLCENCNMNLQTLRGKISRPFAPSMQEIIAISDYLNVSIDFLITGKEREMPHNQVDIEEVKKALKVALDLLG